MNVLSPGDGNTLNTFENPMSKTIEANDIVQGAVNHNHPNFRVKKGSVGGAQLSQRFTIGSTVSE